MQTLFILFQHLVPQHLISRIVGKLAEGSLCKNFLIKTFIRKYGVDLSLSKIQSVEDFANFNAFFTRELQDGARPLASQIGAVLCPADGAISQLGELSAQGLLQAKGRFFESRELLGGDEKLAREFDGGVFATVYLSPKDYHRVHMPYKGSLRRMIYIPGDLFSVNKTTAENVNNLFARNERVVCIFDTDIGPMAVILVGAMIVAAIETVWAGQICPSSASKTIQSTGYEAGEQSIILEAGDELGRFKLGSTAIVLFGQDAINLAPTLHAESSVQMGQLLGTIKN